MVQTGASRSLFENGLIVMTVPDPAAAEEAVHYALLEHREPRRLLLIGGGVNGSLAEALRHPGLTQVDYVELDPMIFEIAAQYFPGCVGKNSARSARCAPRHGRPALSEKHSGFL